MDGGLGKGAGAQRGWAGRGGRQRERGPGPVGGSRGAQAERVRGGLRGAWGARVRESSLPPRLCLSLGTHGHRSDSPLQKNDHNASGADPPPRTPPVATVLPEPVGRPGFYSEWRGHLKRSGGSNRRVRSGFTAPVLTVPGGGSSPAATGRRAGDCGVSRPQAEY